MRLLFGDPVRQFEDAGNTARDAPQLGLVVPGSTRRADHVLERPFFEADARADHPVDPGPRAHGLHQQLDRGAAKFASIVGSVADADQGVADLPCELQGAATRRQNLFRGPELAGGAFGRADLHSVGRQAVCFCGGVARPSTALMAGNQCATGCGLSRSIGAGLVA